MCQKPESRLLTDDGEKATPVLYKGTKEGTERLRSQTPTKAEDRLYKLLLPLKFCLKSYIKTVSPSLIFNRITQVNSQSMDLLLLSQKTSLPCQQLKQQMLRSKCTLFPQWYNREIQFNTAGSELLIQTPICSQISNAHEDIQIFCNILLLHMFIYQQIV